MTTPVGPGFDFDQEIESAWAAFASDLEERLRQLVDGEHILLETMGTDPDESTGAFVRFVSCADVGKVRCEVGGNRQLVSTAGMSGDQEEVLSAGGFTPAQVETDVDGISVASSWVRYGRADELHLLARLGVLVLRGVLGVVDPSLLAHVPAPDEQVPSLGGPRPEDFEPVLLDTAYPVEGPDDLVEMLARSLVTLTGEVVPRDEDGDWMLPFGGHMTWLTLVPGKPVVRIFAIPVWGITSRRAATREVEILNRDSELIRYHLSGDRLQADLDFAAGPFVPRHLAECVSTFQSAITKVKVDFAARTGGHA